MESYITGKFSKIIFQSEDTNYIVALFKVSETNDEIILESKVRTINVTGIIPDVKIDAKYTLKGIYTKHPKYSWQFKFSSFELVKVEGKDAIEEFLSSSFVEGCGKTLAKKIVNTFGDKALEKIREDVNNLLEIKGITPVKAMKIYNSILKYEKDDHLIISLNKLGFSADDCSKILNKHYSDLNDILEGNLYLLKDIFDFSKIDNIYINNFDPSSDLRCRECLLQSMVQMSFNEGSTYYLEEEIYKALSVFFNLNIGNDKFLSHIDYLLEIGEIIKYQNRIYLTKYYMEETYIANFLHLLSNKDETKIKNINKEITELEKKLNIKYNEEQKKAIKEALESNVSIISGGPGTGKTTIIKAIVDIYIKLYNLDLLKIADTIALLAPTGRASKKLSTSTGLPAYTIHRMLKWHKDSDTFEYNEDNKLPHKFVIVDESSMVDVSLMASLLAALKEDSKIIFVGDVYQLPSVGPGLVLQDLIDSDYFAYTMLNMIYRQSDNSYIPFLAKDIKMQNIDEEFMYKRDDYNFIIASEEEIMGKIISSVKYALTKGINEDNMQVLAPMYKGINGIDNLNLNLQKVYNPESEDKDEVTYGDKIYRENDKVLQLINDSDLNVFNGDIGKIEGIYKNLKGKLTIRINFDGNVVDYEKKDLKNITHAYAISIHKSQGSEFEHVIMPICNKYFIMLYNKLLYTGVSRAKKSLTIIGEPRSFTTAIANNYSSQRKTSLKEFLSKIFNEY